MATLTSDSQSSVVAPRAAAGFGYAILSAGSFGLSGPIARGLLDAGWSPAAAVAARVLVAGVVLLPLALRALRGRWRQLPRSVGTLVAYGLFAVAGAQLAYFNAVVTLPVAVALLVEYVAPVAVVGWMWLRHAQRPGRLTLVGALVALGGLTLVLDVVSGSGPSSIVGVVWALGAMVGAAFYFVVSAGGDDDALPGVVLATGGLLVGGVVLILAGLVGMVPLRATTRTVRFEGLGGIHLAAWVTVLGLAVITAAISYTAGIAAIRRLGSRLASFVGLGEVLSAVIFAWLLLGEVPRAIQLGGAVLVVAGVVLVKLGEPREPGAEVSERLDAGTPLP